MPEKFWSKVDKTVDCWLWKGTSKRKYYGQVYRNNRVIAAHRFSWEITYGPIPTGLFVLHKCDNPPCVRPDHLFLGTQRDNLHDRNSKGRANWASGDSNGSRTCIESRPKGQKHFSKLKPYLIPRGEQQGGVKLTELEVLAIREKYSNGVRSAELAYEFGVTQRHIRKIVAKKLWTHI